MAVNLVQQVFRFRTDATAAEGGTPVWAAAQNVNPSLGSSATFRIRFAIANTGTTSTSSQVFSIFVSKNGGAYAQVPSTSSGNAVYSTDVTAGASADNSTIATSLLTGASGTFDPAGEYDSTGSTATLVSSAAKYAEFEFGLAFNSAVVVNGDVYAFRVYAAGVALNAYTVTPTISMGTQAQVTQASLEQFASTNPPAQVTQAALEQWASTGTVSGQAIVTQVALEQWARFQPPLDLAGGFSATAPFAASLTTVKSVELVGGFVPQAWFAGDLTIPGGLTLDGGIVPNIVFAGDLQAAFLDGGITPGVMFGATLDSGPLWGASAPCDDGGWSESDPCPPPGWAPSPPCNATWSPSRLCNG